MQALVDITFLYA